ncbi:2896_t:CDS:2, partial [Acaulospora colombiana]
ENSETSPPKKRIKTNAIQEFFLPTSEENKENNQMILDIPQTRQKKPKKPYNGLTINNALFQRELWGTPAGGSS